MEWKLTEVPGNPTPSLQESTVDVLAAKIEPKLTNTRIRQWSQVCPLDNLRHVKRVRRNYECGGKCDLSIILCLSIGSGAFSEQLPENVQNIVETYQLSPFTAKNGDSEEFHAKLCQTKMDLVLALSNTSKESTKYIHSTILKLQILDHVTMGWDLRWNLSPDQMPKSCPGTKEFSPISTVPTGMQLELLDKEWNFIVFQTEQNLDLFEPFLAFRRALIKILGCEEHLVRHLFQSASALRKGLRFSLAAAALYELKEICFHRNEGTMPNTYFLSRVAKCSATSKEEWEEQCKLWPTSYHPAHDLDVVHGFREEEFSSIFNCMETAIKLSKGDNAAIIVDPSSMQIIAKATDQTHKHDTSGEGKKISQVKADDTCSLNESIDNDGNLLLPGSFPSKHNSLNMEVACINPWGWMKQRTSEKKPLPCEGCFTWHPLRHAPMVVIENAAERDRMMFPPSTSITEPDSNGNLENYCSYNELAKRLKEDTKAKFEHQDTEQSAYELCCGDLSETTRPYLCTGFDIYLVWEPCTMCAMALVHHRFKRVFYTRTNPVSGALGGVHRLHGEKSLNHHYGVFRVSVPEGYLNGLNDSL